MGRISALLITVFIVCGCSTVPTVSTTKLAPVGRVYALQEQGPDHAAITVLRDRNFVGSAVDYQFLIDGTLAARISMGERVTFSVPPGEHILEVRHPSPRLGMPGDSDTLQAKPNERYFYRINTDWAIKLMRTTEESASGSK